MHRFTPAFLLCLPLVLGAPDCTPDTDDEPAGTWYTTCGDPSCGGYTGPYQGTDACTDEVEGDACSELAAECDFESDCNAVLVCAEDDPKDQEGGCPRSQIAYKQDVTYLSAPQRKAAHDRLVSLRLASWRYRDAPDSPRLGFLVDDVPGSDLVRPDGERVDLYGYTSLAVAAIQEQQAQIDALRAELAEVSAHLESCGTTPARADRTP